MRFKELTIKVYARNMAGEVELYESEIQFESPMVGSAKVTLSNRDIEEILTLCEKQGHKARLQRLLQFGE